MILIKFLKKAEKIKKDKQGVSVLLAIMILSSLMILTIAMSDIVLRVGRSTNQIGQSEKAYFAAETAVEKAIYEIEKNNTIANLDVSTPQTLTTSKASWTRTVSQNNTLIILCSQIINQQGVCVNNSGGITTTNPLHAHLSEDKSLQIDFNFSGLSLPNNITITWSGNGEVIASNTTGQTSYNTSPVVLSNLNSYARIINKDNHLIDFELKPGNSNFPISILITGTGILGTEKRILQVEKKLWQIY